VAVAVLALYDQLFLRDRPSRLRVIAFLAAAVPTVAFLGIRALVLGHFPAGPVPFTDNPLVGATFWTARITAFQVLARYFGLLLWPARLSVDYSYNQIPVAIDAKGLAGLALCLAAAGLALWAARRHKALGFAIALFFLALAPVSNVFVLIGSIMAERFLYLPAAGFAIAVAYGLSRLVAARPQARTAALAAVAVVAFAGAARSYARNEDWSAADRLWRSATEAAPNSYKTHINYANSLPLDKAIDRNRAVAEIARALAILDPLPDSQNAPAAYRLAGAIYRQMGDRIALNRAEPDGTTPKDWYQKALAVLFRSDALENARNEELVAYNQRRGTPRSTFLPSSIYFEIGRTYLRQAEQMQALSFYEKGRGLEPNADLLEDEAATLASYGDYRKAAQVYIEALEVDSSRGDLAERIVEMYTKLNPPNSCAVVQQGGAPALNVKCPMVHDDICGAAHNVAETFARRGMTEDATAVRRVAIVDLGCATPRQ
jgi:tetratricopeptide (TPR) repeat protein